MPAIRSAAKNQQALDVAPLDGIVRIGAVAQFSSP
jgi:hypothetical protein